MDSIQLSEQNLHQNQLFVVQKQAEMSKKEEKRFSRTPLLRSISSNTHMHMHLNLHNIVRERTRPAAN